VQARRPRNVILAAIALGVIALAIGSVVFAQTYQPLAYGGPSTGQGPAAVSFHPGFRFSVGMDVENNGRFPVRVLGVPYSSGPFAGLPIAARVMMSRDIGRRPGRLTFKHGQPVFADYRPGGPYVPFQPFDLQPGRERAILVTGVYGNCLDERNLVPISVPDLPVRYSFLWKTATAHIPLPKEQEIIPPSHNCLSGLAAATHMRGGQSHVFKAGTIQIGTKLSCLSHGVRAGAHVPKRGQSVVGTAVVGDVDLPSNGARLSITTHADGSVVATCR
jgi:hypothetical protein